MNQKLRGYQMADWYEHLPPADIERFIDRLAAAGDDGVVDLDALRATAESWPTGGWDHLPTLYSHRTTFLRALSAAHFIRTARGQTLT